MTRFVKMSLVAAVAVAGFSSTVSAQPLEEAIKGVDVSGMLRYRYDDAKSNLTNGKSLQTNEYTMKIATKSKVNDAVTANVQVEALGVNATDNGGAHATTDVSGDRDVTLSVSKANFAVSVAGATVIAGKQSVPSPLVDNSVDDVTRGTGAVALVPAGPVTVAAGYFNNYQKSDVSVSSTTGLAGATVHSGSNISAVAVIGSLAGVSFDAWYVNVASTAKATSVGVKAEVAGVKLDARTSSMNPDAAGTKNGGLTKVVASAKVGPATVVAGLAVTPKDNTGITLDSDNDAQSDFKVWQASVGGLVDATAFLIGAGMDVMPGVNLDAKYVTVDFGTGSSAASELLLGATYAMSKNFGVHARMSWYEVDNAAGVATTDSTKGRLEVKYTF